MALLGFPIGQQETVSQPQQPFVWGQGGQRLTPEDIAMQRQIADQQRMSGADFSPVGSVWEGLGRVVNGLTGSYTRNRAEEAQQANQAESQSIAELLMGQGDAAPDRNAVLQALLNPYASDEVRGLAQMQWQQMNPAPAAPTEFARLQAERDALPVGSPQRLELDQYIAGKADPLITTTLPGDRFFSGPQSSLPTFLQGGGDPISAAPAAPVGRLTPVEPNMENTPSPQLSSGGLPDSLSPAQYQAVVASMGQQATDDWIRRNNIPVRN